MSRLEVPLVKVTLEDIKKNGFMKFLSELRTSPIYFNIPVILGCSGITESNLYIGVKHDRSSGHVEDLSLSSVSYLYPNSASKIWICIDRKFYPQLVRIAQKIEQNNGVGQQKTREGCPHPLGHKDIIFPVETLEIHGIDYFLVEQKPNTMVVVSEAVYHQVCNLGNNLAEAVNFACQRWQVIGRTIKNCSCSNPRKDYHQSDWEPARRLLLDKEEELKALFASKIVPESGIGTAGRRHCLIRWTKECSSTCSSVSETAVSEVFMQNQSNETVPETQHVKEATEENLPLTIDLDIAPSNELQSDIEMPTLESPCSPVLLTNNRIFAVVPLPLDMESTGQSLENNNEIGQRLNFVQEPSENAITYNERSGTDYGRAAGCITRAKRLKSTAELSENEKQNRRQRKCQYQRNYLNKRDLQQVQMDKGLHSIEVQLASIRKRQMQEATAMRWTDLNTRMELLQARKNEIEREKDLFKVVRNIFGENKELRKLVYAQGYADYEIVRDYCSTENGMLTVMLKEMQKIKSKHLAFWRTVFDSKESCENFFNVQLELRRPWKDPW
uniref:JmjC domain-containing protein n=1 Tax=Panagrolaimus sp. JU765 TaxID=591449 RepID=A0AC34Q456_9BILA